jgi:hypothetical protein
MSTFEFTDELFEEFKSLYEKSVKDEKESFEFQGHEVLTSYAKYVIQYLEQNDTGRTSSKS